MSFEKSVDKIVPVRPLRTTNLTVNTKLLEKDGVRYKVTQRKTVKMSETRVLGGLWGKTEQEETLMVETTPLPTESGSCIKCFVLLLFVLVGVFVVAKKVFILNPELF